MSEAARIAALKAAIELRSQSSTVASILEIAQQFEFYLRGDQKPAQEATPGKGAGMRAPGARS